VAASDLIPETHEQAALPNAAFFLLGVASLYLIGIVFE
jgi:hypothetical protein